MKTKQMFILSLGAVCCIACGDDGSSSPSDETDSDSGEGMETASTADTGSGGEADTGDSEGGTDSGSGDGDDTSDSERETDSGSGDTDQTDGDDTSDSEETDSGSGDTGVSAFTADELLEATSGALSGVMTVTTYVDETIPAGMSPAFYIFDVDWNQVAPDFCDHLGNHISCPAVTCDAETREATLSYESSFDGCDVTGCFFASKSVSGEVSIGRSDDEGAIKVTFVDFTIGDLTVNGSLEIRASEDVKQITFSGEASAACPGLHLALESGHEACVSGTVAVTAGDDPATEEVEARTLEMTDVTLVSDRADVVLNGTLIWLDGADCLGPQKGAVTVSFESHAAGGDDEPLVALTFSVGFGAENRGDVRTAIQGSERFADYEAILPRGLFCSLPKVESVDISHGDIADFQETGFIEDFIRDLVERVTAAAVENPKVKALRAATQGLTVDDMIARLSEVGDGKVVRFIQAPVKGLCRLDDTATCPALTVTCGDPPGDGAEPTFFECNDVGYEPGAEGDPVPEAMLVDFTGDDGTCTTQEGDTYGGHRSHRAIPGGPPTPRAHLRGLRRIPGGGRDDGQRPRRRVPGPERRDERQPLRDHAQPVEQR